MNAKQDLLAKLSQYNDIMLYGCIDVFNGEQIELGYNYTTEQYLDFMERLEQIIFDGNNIETVVVFTLNGNELGAVFHDYEFEWSEGYFSPNDVNNDWLFDIIKNNPDHICKLPVKYLLNKLKDKGMDLDASINLFELIENEQYGLAYQLLK